MFNRAKAWSILVLLVPLLVSPAAGEDTLTQTASAQKTTCRMADVGWEMPLPCGVSATITITLPEGCPNDTCPFIIESAARGHIKYPSFYELSTMVMVGDGVQYYACLGANKEQDDFFSEHFPEYFPCPQTCRDNGFGWEPVCEGSLQSSVVVPPDSCNDVDTMTSFGYLNSGAYLWIGFLICRTGSSIEIYPAPWND